MDHQERPSGSGYGVFQRAEGCADHLAFARQPLLGRTDRRGKAEAGNRAAATRTPAPAAPASRNVLRVIMGARSSVHAIGGSEELARGRDYLALGGMVHRHDLPDALGDFGMAFLKVARKSAAGVSRTANEDGFR